MLVYQSNALMDHQTAWRQDSSLELRVSAVPRSPVHEHAGLRARDAAGQWCAVA